MASLHILGIGLNTWLVVALGGGLGALSRFGAAQIIPTAHSFPWATIIVNLLGCLLIGLAYQYFLNKNSTVLSPFLMVGFLGGFTTFSSFGLESMMMYEQREFGKLLWYVGASNIGGLVAVLLGVMAGKSIWPETLDF